MREVLKITFLTKKFITAKVILPLIVHPNTSPHFVHISRSLGLYPEMLEQVLCFYTLSILFLLKLKP